MLTFNYARAMVEKGASYLVTDHGPLVAPVEELERAYLTARDDAAFVAEHGSWNRTAKVGYRVMVLREREGRLVYEPFVTGFLDGRPSGPTNGNSPAL